MELTYKGIQNRNSWTDKGIRLPEFDIDAMKREAARKPVWIHFGAGNIFRGFIGSIAQRLLNSGNMASGIIAAESFDLDIIDKIYDQHDDLTLNVLMDKGSGLHMEVLAGIAESVKADDHEKLRAMAESPSLQLLSFTITEKGYAVSDTEGRLFSVVESDIENDPDAPKHTMSIIASMLYDRYRACAAPIAAVSMDNCSHNGEKLRNGVMAVARGWAERGYADQGFIDYLSEKVSFPWSMIDKITPRPDERVRKQLEDIGIEDMNIAVTDKNTYIAPFVNAEIPHYLVIEDDFPNGRPPFEKAGVYMTTRETVNKAETMKVTSCLNPLHTGLAVFGCMLGYTGIHEEMQDPELSRLVRRIAEEGMRVVIDPGIIDPADFVNEVIDERLQNPNIPDTPQRIATDTSQKLSIRYGETIKAYERSSELDASKLEAIPMVIAGWLRYLMAEDDSGNSFTPSPDPMLSVMRERLAGIKTGSPESAEGHLKDILSNEVLFGTDLYAAGLGEKTERLFASMLKGPGAVRAALKTLK